MQSAEVDFKYARVATFGSINIQRYSSPRKDKNNLKQKKFQNQLKTVLSKVSEQQYKMMVKSLKQWKNWMS